MHTHARTNNKLSKAPSEKSNARCQRIGRAKGSELEDFAEGSARRHMGGNTRPYGSGRDGQETRRVEHDPNASLRARPR
eukprot:14294435-Alexandrium_andersonii.AAC.1